MIGVVGMDASAGFVRFVTATQSTQSPNTVHGAPPGSVFLPLTVSDEGGFVGGIESSEFSSCHGPELELVQLTYERAVALSLR